MTTDTLNHHHDHQNDHHHEHDSFSKVTFGFWIFLLSDCSMFSALFASYDVLKNHTINGIGIKDIASMPYLLVQSLLLLACPLFCGIAQSAFYKRNKAMLLFSLLLSLLFGLAFIAMQANEYAYLINSGNSWHKSAFLSIFFSLLGVHSAHLVVALLWTVILMIQFSMKGLTAAMRTRLTCLSMFFAFLNIIWLFIFTIVYLMGAI